MPAGTCHISPAEDDGAGTGTDPRGAVEVGEAAGLARGSAAGLALVVVADDHDPFGDAALEGLVEASAYVVLGEL